VSHKIAQNKTPQTIIETVILPATTENGEKCAQQLRNIPLSNKMASRRIAEISEGLEGQLIEKIRNKSVSIQNDETTDYNSIGHLIAAYVRFVEDTTINKDMFFCKHIK
jgi:hypothetical protein